MRICIFCSASNVAPAYMNAAAELAGELARRGNTLVWGGSNVGTMKVIADAAEAAGGELVGVSVEFLKDKIRPGVEQMYIMPTLAERKAKLLELADAIVVLPGGTGTLDEITEVMELKKHSLHDKPIVFLNTDGFYDGFKMQLECMDTEGFLPRPLAELLSFEPEPHGALDAVEQLTAKAARV